LPSGLRRQRHPHFQGPGYPQRAAVEPQRPKGRGTRRQPAETLLLLQHAPAFGQPEDGHRHHRRGGPDIKRPERGLPHRQCRGLRPAGPGAAGGLPPAGHDGSYGVPPPSMAQKPARQPGPESRPPFPDSPNAPARSRLRPIHAGDAGRRSEPVAARDGLTGTDAVAGNPASYPAARPTPARKVPPEGPRPPHPSRNPGRKAPAPGLCGLRHGQGPENRLLTGRSNAHP
jgi:hypothetical protein